MSQSPSEQVQGLNETQAYLHNMGLMQQIVREMREIPELPSEKPTDVHPLEKVEFPEKGGVLTYMGGHAHPYKGFPFFEFVDKIDTIKKVQKATLSSLFHSFKGRRLSLIGLLFVPWLFKELARAYIYTFYRIIERFRVKTLRYSDAIRELHRACSIQFEETAEERELRYMIRDLVCMVLEFDNAYRFRFQDVIVELDKAALRKNPGKELTRLLTLMQSRETTQEVKDTWTLVRYFLPWYIRLNSSLKKAIVGVLSELDLETVKLSAEDTHFAKERKDYKFAFMK